MIDNKDVMAWAVELSNQALTEGRSGDTSLLNRLGGNKAFEMFMNNSVFTNNVPQDKFPAYYGAAWAEIRRLYEDTQKQEEVHQTVDKVAALESKLDALTAQLTAFIESQQKPVEKADVVDRTDAPSKKTSRKPAKVEADETETPAEDESEA